MSWKYSQKTGRLYRPDGTHAATGYAGGNCGKNPEGINNPTMQFVKSVGPICKGLYHRGTVVLKSHLGPFAIPLIADHTNTMGGRGGFYMHGDTTPSGNASEGCIILPRVVREEFYNSPDALIEVL